MTRRALELEVEGKRPAALLGLSLVNGVDFILSEDPRTEPREVMRRMSLQLDYFAAMVEC